MGQWHQVYQPDHSVDSLFDTDHPQSPDGLAAALAPPAAPGHFDELRGHVTADAAKSEASNQELEPSWGLFFDRLGLDGFTDLDHRSANLKRQIRDNGVTYNVYADASGPQRPWSLDLFPLIISPQSWQQIEVGVLQRVRVLDHVMADVYGPQKLLASGLLPPALVQGHPGYLRAMNGVTPVGGTHLQVAAFDLARGPDGNWWVVSQRTQAPSGLGYLLENRLSISRQFPQAFEALHVQRLAASYRALVEGLKRMSPAGADSHIALLTPGPYNETYFEHAYLARYLGLSLVEGNDLTVRDQRLYLKTLQGLEPVHGLLKRVDDEFLDPLELRADSRLGVPGLLQAIRAGHVLVANAPGSAFLESPALLGFLPTLSEHLLSEVLILPALPTWWCGERAALQDVLPLLGERVIKATYPGGPGSFNAVPGRSLQRRALDEWAGRILRNGDAHTVQDYLPLSQLPTWDHARESPRIVPRSVMLRVFAICDGPQSWRVLPGGLTRIATANEEVASMQRGGSSADTWVLTRGPGDVDRTTLLPQIRHPAAVLPQRKPLVTSRAAESLYWLGRYTERCENTIRLAHLTLDCLHGDDPSSQPLLIWLGDLAVRNALVLSDVPAARLAPRVFERSLIAGLGGQGGVAGVGFNLRAARLAAFAVRERLSQEQWNMIVRAEQEFAQRSAAHVRDGEHAAPDIIRALDAASVQLAAITGAQNDRMARDDGWRLLSIGRYLERLGFLAASLAHGFETGSVHDTGGFEAMVALFDNTITFHARHQQSRDVAALLDLLVLDRDTPRSLGWVAQALAGRLAKLASSDPGKARELARQVPEPGSWNLEQLCSVDSAGQHHRLMEMLQRCTGAVFTLSDEISALYFTHSLAPEPVAGT
ncbi:MAG: circularly permuted type 2 ATP-grasp protein [Rhodoferax sp.]